MAEHTPRVFWTSYQRDHIERRHSVTQAEFEQAWADRDDLGPFDHPNGPYFESFGFTDDDRLLEMVWRWQDGDVWHHGIHPGGRIMTSNDPRTPEQKKADARVQRDLTQGRFPRGSASERKASIERARRKKQARREAAALGLGLRSLRQSLGLSQEELARSLGTQRSAISRLESGRHGGITIETFLLVLSAIEDHGLPFATRRPECAAASVSMYDEGVACLEASACIESR